MSVRFLFMLLKPSARFTLGCAAAFAVGLSVASAQNVRVSITNNAPEGGVFLTPVWVGFHDGSFDSYNGGLSAQEGLERIAEDGNPAVISADFLGGYTYINDPDGSPISARVLSSQSGDARTDGTAGAAPIAPGQTVTLDVTIDMAGANRYLSYVSMVLPSNDYYVANGNPTAHDLMSLYDAPAGTTLPFDIGLSGAINDAGTEVNFANIADADDQEDDTVAGLGVLGENYVGQMSPDTGDAENGVNANVQDPYSAAPSLLTDHPDLDFNDGRRYPMGIATITVTTLEAMPTAGNGGDLTGMCGVGGAAFLPLMAGLMCMMHRRVRRRR